jgi:tetratricopeptide (TPR) repeat protein
MVAEEDHNREQGEEADFTDMLEKFKAGVAANVDDEDFDSHYDLGVAYKEMGLIEEAIAEFQKALRGAIQRIRAYEARGQCFSDRNDGDTAITDLGRAARAGMEDEDLIGVPTCWVTHRRVARSPAMPPRIISGCSHDMTSAM